MAHTHPVYDTDRNFLVDPYSRKLINQSPEKIVFMQNDHNCERITFEIPRYVEGHDMSICNRVRVHYINAGTIDGKSASHSDAQEIDDLHIDPENEEAVLCSWLIKDTVTGIPGSLSFTIVYECLTGDRVDYRFSANPYSDIKILAGIDSSETIVEETYDILEHWRNELVNAGILAAETAASSVADRIDAIIKRTTGTITLTVANWVDNKQSISIPMLTENTSIFFTPATKTDQTTASNALIFTSVNGSSVTFEVEEMPMRDISFTYLIIGFDTAEGIIEEYDGTVVIE